MNLTIILKIEADGSRSVCARGSFVDVEADPLSFTVSAGSGVRLDTEGYGYVLLDAAHLIDLALVHELVEEADTHHEDGLLTGDWIIEWLQSRDFDAESLTLETLTEKAA